MAKTKQAPAQDGAEAVEPAPTGGRKKILLLAAPLLALVAGGWFVLGPGAGTGEAVAEAPEPGVVLELEPITMNLADGRLLKVGLALQVVAEPTGSHGEVTGAVALDEAISYLGGHTYDQLVAPATREVAKQELSKRVYERYHHDVLEVYFTEFVMQ
jgi:flagellar FliL protein